MTNLKRATPFSPAAGRRALVACLAAVLLPSPFLRADPPAATQPAASAHPLLDQLNRETQELYRGLQGGVLRVQMPAPRWVNDLAARDNRFDRYNLDPAVKQQLLDQRNPRRAGPATQPGPQQYPLQNSLQNGQEQQAGGYGQNVEGPRVPQPQLAQQLAGPPASNPPQGAPAPAQAAQAQPDLQQGAQQGVVIVVPRPNGTDAQQELIVGNRVGNTPANVRQPGPPVVPNNVGLVLDGQGHVLVPLYVEREAAADRPIRLIGPDGEAVEAKYVGSDQQTNITILQLPPLAADSAGDAKGGKGGKDEPGPKPARDDAAVIPIKAVKLSKAKPVEGSLVLYLSPTDGSGRLGVWNAASRDYGVVVGVDGQVLGVARYGQFLTGSACQLIADQIIRFGVVKRATLGVIITQVEKDDPLRRDQPLLGERPAVRVDQVMKDSPADRGGLKQGDVILTLSGEAVNDIPSVAAAVAARSGQTRLQVLRGDRVIDVTVDLQQK